MNSSFKLVNPDFFGAAASSLCLVHCMATPFLFVAKACSATCCNDTPVWWQAIDYLFIVVSFVAIFYSTRNTLVNWVKYGLWGFWGVLVLTVLNETLEFGLVPEWFIYIPAFAIIALHMYNLKYCKCDEEVCCVA
jgi:hypothetical protein